MQFLTPPTHPPTHSTTGQTDRHGSAGPASTGQEDPEVWVCTLLATPPLPWQGEGLVLPLSLEDELRVVVEGGEVLVVAGPQPLPHEAHVHGLLHLGQVQLLQHQPAPTGKPSESEGAESSAQPSRGPREPSRVVRCGVVCLAVFLP